MWSRAWKARCLQVVLPSDGSGDTAGILDEGRGCGLSRCEDCVGQACAQALHAVHGLGRLQT